MNEELQSYLSEINLDNEVIYDIGANKGEMINFFNKHSTNSQIIGIEPHPNNIQILKQKFNNCLNIKIIEGAVNTFDGNCYVGFEQQQRINGLKQGHIMNNNTDLQGREWLQGTNVKCYKLDNFCKDADIIKMDIEGFEHNLLYDSLPNLNYVKNWLLEIHSWEDINYHGWTIHNHNKENDSLNKMIKLFIENGYKKYILAKKRNIKKPINENFYWTDVPISSYMQNNEKIYYKVVNLIIKR